MSAGVETIIIEILVTGLPSSGKSSLMRTISQRTGFRNNDPQDWHSGYLNVDIGLDVHFIEPPASSNFDFIWLRDLIAQTDVPGFIVLCDSTRPEFFGETIGILQTIRAYHPDVPCVLVANKQDHNMAWSAEDIRIGLGIPNDILVVPCIAHNMEAVRDVVLQLLYQILGP